MHNVSVVADQGDWCGESPLWDETRKVLRWVDIARSRVHSLDPSTAQVSSRNSDVPVSALALTPGSPLIAAGGRGVWLLSQPPVAITNPDLSTEFAVNDAIADTAGRPLIGTTFFTGMQDGYRLGNLCSIALTAPVRF